LYLGVFVFVASACGVPPSVSASPGIVSACPPTSTNPYRLYQPPNQVTNIFLRYKNNSTIYDNVRQDAFIQLGRQIKQWSDYEDVIIDGQIVRITITYLDPMLVQYIVLNEALASPNNLLDQSWFESQIQAAMTSLANRNKIMFIITVASQFQESALYLNLPITNLELTSSSVEGVQLAHYDSILSERIDVSHKPVYGYLGYPVAAWSQGNCVAIVDQQTTSLKLDHKASLESEHPFYPLYWNISYPSLVSLQGNEHQIPTVDPFIDFNRFSKSEVPPLPNLFMNDANMTTYWEEMARYIWGKVILINDK
jgi:hypothetical protein